MKATILTQNPFLVPYGTKVKLTRTGDNFTFIGFFAGYRTYGREFLYNKSDLFPVFKAESKAGTMSNRNAIVENIGDYDLKNWELEILSIPMNTHETSPLSVDPNRYSDMTSNIVVLCTLQLCTLAENLGVKEIDFTQHPDIDTPHAVFDNGMPEEYDSNKWLAVRKLIFNPEPDEENIRISVVSEENGYEGYLDDQYGDMFDVAQSLPLIFNSAVKVLKKIAESKAVS